MMMMIASNARVVSVYVMSESILCAHAVIIIPQCVIYGLSIRAGDGCIQRVQFKRYCGNDD